MAFSDLNAIEMTIGPQAALEHMGLQIVNGPHGPTTRCPADGGTLMVHSHGFACLNAGCAFGAGSPIDLLAIRTKSYIGAVQALPGLYQEELASVSMDKVGAKIADQARVRRELYEFFRDYSRPQPDTDIATAEARSWLRKQELADEISEMFFTPASKKLQRKLAEILANEHVDTAGRRWRPGRDAILAPYYTNHHSISGFYVMPYGVDGRAAARYIMVDPARFAFGGLPRVHAGCQRASLEMTTLRAARFCNRLMGDGRDQVCLAYRYDSAEANNRRVWMPAEVVFRYDRECEAAAGHIDALLDTGVTVTVQRPGMDDRPLYWEDFLCSEAAACAKERMDKAVVFLDSVRMPPALKTKVISHLRLQLPGNMVEFIDRRFAKTLIHRDKDHRIFESPEGYFLLKERTGEEIQVSNFTARFHRMVFHRDGPDNDMVSEGILYYGKRQQPFSVDNTRFEEVTFFEATAQKCMIDNRESDDETDPLPVVMDKPGMKKVLNYLKCRGGDLKLERGAPCLGWTHNGAEFFLPGLWFTDKTVESVGPLHPRREDLRQLFGEPCEPEAWHEGAISEAAADCVSAVVAQLCRTQQELPVQPIVVKDDKESREFLAALFRAFGQIRIPDFSARTAKGCEILGARGIPIVVSDMKTTAVTDSNYPFWCLKEHGDRLRVSGEEGPAAARVLADFLRKLVPTIIEMPALYTRHKKASHFDELAREGADFIARGLRTNRWPIRETDTPCMESLLRQIPKDAPNRFRFYMADQRLLINMAGLDAPNAADLELELVHLGASFTDIVNNVLEVDSVIGMDVLRNYYEGMPTLDIRRDKKDDSDLADDKTVGGFDQVLP